MVLVAGEGEYDIVVVICCLFGVVYIFMVVKVFEKVGVVVGSKIKVEM